MICARISKKPILSLPIPLREAATPHQHCGDCRNRRSILKNSLEGEEKGLRIHSSHGRAGRLKLRGVARLEQSQEKGTKGDTSDHPDGACEHGETPGYALLVAWNHAHHKVHIGDLKQAETEPLQPEHADNQRWRSVGMPLADAQ